MGARGANIQKVCSDFNVQIKIPDRKSNKNNQQQNGDSDLNGGDEQNDHDIIRISGRTENCEDAAEALRALVPINIEVSFLLVCRNIICGHFESYVWCANPPSN